MTMWPFSNTVAEVAAPLTLADQLAEAKQECTAAKAALDAACRNSTNPSRPFAYRTGTETFIQTPKGGAERQAQDHAIRKSLARFHAAWRRLAMIKNPKLIL